jgi:predicted phage terminase large subunit-like protein
MVVQSIDAPLKDKETNDLFATQAWGVVGADRYLLDKQADHMNYHKAKRVVIEQAQYVRRMFPYCSHFVLIENAGYGVDLILDLKREITGVKKLSHSAEGDKTLRAETAADGLESGNCFLPGYRVGTDELAMPDEDRTPAEITSFIDACAMFPNGRYDDEIDAWSQMMNWLRSRPASRARVYSSFKARR